MTDEHEIDTTEGLERALLGLMMSRSDAVWEALQQLHPTDFEQPRHEVIARTIVRLANSGKPYDVLAVGDALEQDGQVQQAGGIAYLHVLDGYASGDPSWLATAIRTRSLRRKVKHLGASLANAGPEQDPKVLLADAMLELRQLQTGAGRRPTSAREQSDSALDSIGASGPVALPTPWPPLDQLIGGIVPGRLYVIGARPAEGKSMLALNLAAHLSRMGGVAYSSLEMSTAELMRRLLASESEVYLRKLEYGGLDQEDWEAVRGAKQRIDQMRLFINDESDQAPIDIKLHALAAAREAPMRAIVVDYLSLLRTPSDKRNRWEHIGEITREFKRLAKDLGVAVILLAQLSREYETSRGKQPRPPALHDLRESGNIEQDADVVMLLQRGHNDDGTESHRLNVHVAKNRQGRRGIATLLWRAHIARLDAATGIELPIGDPDDD